MATTLAAVAFGVAVLILIRGFIDDIYEQLRERVIHSQTGHVQIALAGYFAHGAHSPDQYIIDLPQKFIERLRARPGVDGVTSRVTFSGLLSNGRSDISIIGEGVDVEGESRLGTHTQLLSGRNLSQGDRFHVLIGQGVAQTLRLRPGDQVILMASASNGAMNTLDLEVAGVFQTFSKEFDARAIRLPLVAAQDLMGKQGANVLVVSLQRTADTDSWTSTFRMETSWQNMEAKSWHELNDFYPKVVDLYERQFGGFQLIILLLVLLSVVNAVNMTVFERIGEFGTIRALGYKNQDVFRLVVVESCLLGLIGAVVGVALGIGLALWISSIGIPMPPPPNSDVKYSARILIGYQNIIGAFIVGMLGAIVASLFPAFRISRIAVAQSLAKPF